MTKNKFELFLLIFCFIFIIMASYAWICVIIESFDNIVMQISSCIGLFFQGCMLGVLILYALLWRKFKNN